jgi:hypothetical protein
MKTRGLAGKLLHTVGDGFGKLATTVGQAADTTGRRAALAFVGGNRKPVPERSCSDLAESMSNWLSKRQKGEGSDRGTIELKPLDTAFELRFQESGMLGKRLVFHFAPLADATSTARFQQRSAESGGCLIALDWPVDRLTLEIDCFLWNDGVRLARRTPAADYISMWLMDELGFQFEALELSAGAEPSSPGLFLGRARELSQLTEALGQPRRLLDTPWIFSITGLGGAGKSYLLRQIEQRYRGRILFAQVDHQNVEGNAGQSPSGALMSLLQALVIKLERGGCACARFNKTYSRLLRQAEASAPKVAAGSYFGRLLDLGKKLNPVLLAAEAGLAIYEAYARELKAEGEALAANSQIQRLTRALIDDLSRFVTRQRKQYYLWQRPVLAFDTYEITGSLLDTWLRTLLLADPEFVALEPVILVAGRHELVRVNTRWSELQGALSHLRLTNFDADESDRYLRALGVDDPEQRRTGFELTGGSPLFLSLIANASSLDAAVQALTERILEEVPPADRQLFLEASVSDGFNKDSLARLFDDPEFAFERLSRATFVQAEGGQWRFAPTVRKILRRCLELESPERFSVVVQKTV